MTKPIVKIIEVPEGGMNPKTNLHEKPIWTVRFGDGEERSLMKNKIIEYLSMSYHNSVASFEKQVFNDLITGWVIVFQDHKGKFVAEEEFYNQITDGHMRRNREDVKAFEYKPAQPQSPIFTERKSLTTLEERKKIDTFREFIKKDARPHPEATGYEDSK